MVPCDGSYLLAAYFCSAEGDGNRLYPPSASACANGVLVVRIEFPHPVMLQRLHKPMRGNIVGPPISSKIRTVIARRSK
jgi:hypothetical protein